MQRTTAFGAVLMAVLGAFVAVPAAPAAAAGPISCQAWGMYTHNSHNVRTEVEWPDDGSVGTLRARPATPPPPFDTHWFTICKWGGYETISHAGLYVAAEKDWTGIYAGTLRARTISTELGIWERFHFTCYPPHPANPYPGSNYCTIWSEATGTYVAAEGGTSNTADPYYGILRARTPGANVGGWELFYFGATGFPV
jgi:hypothetical protein